MTSMEREEKEKVKKREKKLEDEETMQQATWVKYTFPIKHQVGRILYILTIGRYSIVIHANKENPLPLLCISD